MITSFSIKNFMSIGNAVLEYDGTNVIELCGKNDSGKSAVVRLLDIMFYNAYQTEQVRYIKDDEEYFEGVLTFADGVSYMRRKYQNGTSVYELRMGTEVLYTNRVGTSLVSVNDVPKPIQDYLGVLRDEYTNEKLNIRRCTDKLFLIETSGGDNYKIFNSILRSEAMAKSATELNKDKNRLQQEMTINYSQLATLKDEFERIRVSSKESLDVFGESIDKTKAQVQRAKSSSVLNDLLIFMRDIVVPDELVLVDTDRVSALMELCRLRGEAQEDVGVELQEMDTDRLDAVGAVVQSLEEYRGAECKVGAEMCTVDVDRLEFVTGVHSLFERLRVLDGEVNAMNTKYEGMQKELCSLAEEYDFVICDNCGGIVMKGEKHIDG